MESRFKSLKAEHGEQFSSYGEAQGDSFHDDEVLFDEARRHSALGYVGPAEFERSSIAVAAA